MTTDVQFTMHGFFKGNVLGRVLIGLNIVWENTFVAGQKISRSYVIPSHELLNVSEDPTQLTHTYCYHNLFPELAIDPNYMSTIYLVG